MTAAQRSTSLDTADPRALVRPHRRLPDAGSSTSSAARPCCCAPASCVRRARSPPTRRSAAEDYTILARAVQRQATRLADSAPVALAKLRQRHESLATQMAENLRVLATARAVAEDLARGRGDDRRRPATRRAPIAPAAPRRLTKATVSGLSVNRAL